MGCKADGEDEYRSNPKAHKRRAKRTEAQAGGIESREAPLPLRGDRRGQLEGEDFIKPSNEADRLLDVFYLRTAAIPGSSIPSRYSSIAPPPVET